MAGRPANCCYFILLFVSVLTLLDMVYFNYLLSWHHKGNNHPSNGHRIEQCTRNGCLDVQNQVDPRTRSNFEHDADLPYVPSKKKSSREQPSIPHIIHQMWDSENIPTMFHKWLPTWAKDNPDWEYWLWTLAEIELFIKQEFPEFVRLHDVYTADIFRFDMVRYLVLYKFGGIYLDLDMESLKPLDNWTYGFQCLISEETYAHPFVVREQDPPANTVNGFIAASPQHPFLKLLIDSLEEFAGNYLGDYLHATGPFFLNDVLERYLSTDEPRHDITILPPKFFFPTYDPNESDLISSRCYPGQRELLDEAGQLTCKELNRVFLQRTPDVASYTDHHWVHAYLFNSDWKNGLDTKPIHELIPHAKTKHSA